MDWSEIATKSDLDDRFEAFELRITAHVDRALRLQTQWVFGTVVLQASALIVAILTLA